MDTKAKILAQLTTKENSSWEEVKKALHYSEFPSMMKTIRGMEKDGLLHRHVGKDDDGKHTLEVRKGKRPQPKVTPKA